MGREQKREVAEKRELINHQIRTTLNSMREGKQIVKKFSILPGIRGL